MVDLEGNLLRADAVCLRGRQLLSTGQRILPPDVDHWFADLINSLEVLEREVKNAACPNNMKQRLLVRISVMMTLRSRVEDATRTDMVGAGLGQLPQRVQYHEVETAFQRRLRNGVISNLRHLELTDFLDEAETVFVSEIQRALGIENALRVYVLLKSDYVKAGDENPDTKTFNTKSADIFPSTDLREWFNEHVRVPLLRDVEEFQDRDSRWTSPNVLNLTLHINKFVPIRANSYVPLPEHIRRRQCCINVNNRDLECFKWAVLSALFPVAKDPQRVTKYVDKVYVPFDRVNVVSFDGLEFPVHPRQSHKFERINATISVNVYMLELREIEEKGERSSRSYLVITQRRRSSTMSTCSLSNPRTPTSISWHQFLKMIMIWTPSRTITSGLRISPDL